jgi:hypothetical protein
MQIRDKEPPNLEKHRQKDKRPEKDSQPFLLVLWSDAKHGNRSNVQSSGTAAELDVECNSDKQISQINRNWQGQRLLPAAIC